jgi:hypothetical protein
MALKSDMYSYYDFFSSVRNGCEFSSEVEAMKGSSNIRRVCSQSVSFDNREFAAKA